MSGQYNGLQARFKEYVGTAASTPCASHTINLIGNSAAESCSGGLHYFHFVQNIYSYVYFSSSSRRWNILKGSLRDDSNTAKAKNVKKVSDTRWSARADAVSALRLNYKNIKEALIQISISETEKPMSKLEAQKLAKKFDHYETALITVQLWDKLLQRINSTGKSLQDVQSNLLHGANLHKSLSDFIKDLRYKFEDIENEANLLTNNRNYKDSDGRIKKRKLQFGKTSDNDTRLNDCLHLQLYRDSKDRYKQGQTKASLSLEHFLGLETGFTLDKESNTVAILCQDVVVILAFDSRERLMQWQVKLSNHLGDGAHFLVLLSSAPSKARIPPGPARLHVQEYGFCLTTGVPPRVAGHWLISHLRRYGVVEGRFCFEGGSRCGVGEGLYVLLTDQGEEITTTLKLASQGQLFTSRRRPVSRNMSVMDSPRRSTIRTDIRKHEPSPLDAVRSGTDSPYTDLESNYGCGDGPTDSWNVPPIERCMSCISKLGALSRSSTTATTPGAPCWEHACDRQSLSSGSDCSGWSQTVTKPPARPPKPYSTTSPHKKVMSPPPPPSYDNYDIPKIPFPVGNNGTIQESKHEDHYDTPRKIKECLTEAVRKPCGCVLRVRQPDQERPCVCQRLLSCWTGQEDVQALYATVDVSKKCIRNHNYANLQPNSSTTANYANMEFAQSLELYENAKQVVQNVGLCNKCGHPQGDYLMMEPAARKKTPPSGYLPMSPAIKHRLGKMLSTSNPNLAPAVDRGGKPSGSAMLQANVYQRKQLLDSTDNLEQRRRRSNSADSSRCEDGDGSICNCAQSVVRRSSSVPCKSNRDSSSSNDSGVFELPRRVTPCVTTLPRRSKSSDPLRDLSFQFQKVDGKSASAEAEVPVCPSESTSSATSDMSDYIETLSLSSHSSNEAPPPSCTLRPRSGNEYLTLQRLIAPVPEEHHN